MPLLRLSLNLQPKTRPNLAGLKKGQDNSYAALRSIVNNECKVFLGVCNYCSMTMFFLIITRMIIPCTCFPTFWRTVRCAVSNQQFSRHLFSIMMQTKMAKSPHVIDLFLKTINNNDNDIQIILISNNLRSPFQLPRAWPQFLCFLCLAMLALCINQQNFVFSSTDDRYDFSFFSCIDRV